MYTSSIRLLIFRVILLYVLRHVFYGMFYIQYSLYDYNSHTHIIPPTPIYNKYQASFS